MTHSLDLTVLRLLRDRKKYERYQKAIPSGTLTAETKALIKRFGEFFETTDAASVTFDEFWPFLRSRYPNWKPKDEEHWHALIKPIDKDNPAGLDENIIHNLLTADLSAQALTLIEKWSQGGEVDLSPALRDLLDTYDMQQARKDKAAAVVLDFDHMVQVETSDSGLHWRLECLNQSMRPLRAGDFGIVAARPDAGKSSYICDQVSYMASQLKDLGYPPHRGVMHLNNESVGARMLQRYIQAALSLKITEMVALGADELSRRFAAEVGTLQVFDIHSWNTLDVEALFIKHQPAIVVVDMLDNLQYAGKSLNGDSRTDQILELLYQWLRMMAVKYDFVALATSQLREEAEGMQWPTQGMLKDSRTGKAGAVDFVLTLGRNATMPNTRFVGLAKNKLRREGGKYSPEAQVFFDSDRSRFKEAIDVE